MSLSNIWVAVGPRGWRRFAAIRETEEEVGLRVSEATECAMLRFIFTNGYNLEVTVFTTTVFAGELTLSTTVGSMVVNDAVLP